jgi:hypothetical protein
MARGDTAHPMQTETPPAMLLSGGGKDRSEPRPAALAPCPVGSRSRPDSGQPGSAASGHELSSLQRSDRLPRGKSYLGLSCYRVIFSSLNWIPARPNGRGTASE